MKYTIPKGTFDILPKDPAPDGFWRSSHLWHFVEEKIHEIARAYGYHEIRTPIFEQTDLFIRGVGEASDIVIKEMYTFEDKGGRSVTLRPEGTASVMRAFVEKRLDQQGSNHKLYYIGPLFRYERPQAGRYRQFHQFGFEAIGDPSPEQDVEIIQLLCELYRRIGLKDFTLMINSIGDVESRKRYREALRDYLKPHFNELSEDSKIRFEKNVLRILDSKDPNDQQLLKEAPSILGFLTPEAKEHFDKVKNLLNKLNVDFVINSKLMRGLDYYTKTVFEVTAGELGAQNALGGGGRFDGLIHLLGGPDLPSVGFAGGIERLIQTMIGQNIPLPLPPHPLIFFIPLGEKAKDFCFSLVYALRRKNVAAEIDWNPKKVGNSLNRAVDLGSNFALILGDDELTTGQVKLKELKSRQEIPLNLDLLEEFLLGYQKTTGLV